MYAIEDLASGNAARQSPSRDVRSPKPTDACGGTLRIGPCNVQNNALLGSNKLNQPRIVNTRNPFAILYR